MEEGESLWANFGDKCWKFMEVLQSPLSSQKTFVIILIIISPILEH
jgi:hypothetical protein